MVAQVGPLAVAGLVFVAGAFLPESDYGRTSTLIGLVQWLLQVPLGVPLLYPAAATIYFDMADAISLRVVAPAPVVSLVSSLARGHRGGRDYLGDVYTEVFVAALGWAVGIGYLLGVSVALRRHHYLVAKLAAAFAIPTWPVAGGIALLLGAALTKSPVRATQVGSRDSADE